MYSSHNSTLTEFQRNEQVHILGTVLSHLGLSPHSQFSHSRYTVLAPFEKWETEFQGVSSHITRK